MSNKNKIMQKDHLIIPKSTLLRFADDKDKKVSVLDFNDIDNIKIVHVTSKSFHSELGYFDPQYDENVKKIETRIGKAYRSIKSYIDTGLENTISFDTASVSDLKNAIIEFITIEFHRMVVTNKSFRDKYRDQQQAINDDIDVSLFRAGLMTRERLEYSLNYRQVASSDETFRLYCQNILGTKQLKQLYRI